MENILLYFIYKYHHHWDNVYQAIASKEMINHSEIDKIQKSLMANLLTIVNDNYPNCFKDMYMPPLSFVYEGNLSLLEEQILGIYGKLENKDLIELKKLNKKQYVLCICDHDLELEIYHELINYGFKIIILSQKPFSDLKKFTFNFNTLILTECIFLIPFENSPEQTLSRLFYVVCTKILLINKLINTLKIIFEHHQTKLKPCYILDKKEINSWIKQLVNEQLIYPIKKMSEIILQKS